METMIPPQVGMRPRTKKGKKKRPKKRGRKVPNKKMREKERRDNATILFTTLVLQSSTMVFMIKSLLCCHFHIQVGIFRYRTWLLYSNDGLPQIALALREQASWMHTHLVSFVELSYTYSSSASVAWQSLLTDIDIYWWTSP